MLYELAYTIYSTDPLMYGIPGQNTNRQKNQSTEN